MIENKPINTIKPYEKNAKKHPKKQVQQVANSIKEFGFNQPIVVDKNNVVIVGHGRLEASKLLGLTEVPCITVDITEDQAKAYRLADNKLNESDWDMGLVIDELKGLTPELVDLTGFEKDLIIEPEEKDDEVPETPEEPQSKLGDLYELGNHRVLCGDSTNVDDLELLMNNTKADMVFTDPPWNVNYGDTKEDNAQGYKPRKILNDALGDSFVPWLSEVFSMTNAFSKDGCPTYVVMSAQEWGGAYDCTFSDRVSLVFYYYLEKRSSCYI